MKRYARILVCVDRTEKAARMLAYVQAIARLASPKKIHLLHVADAGAGTTDDELAPSPPEPEITADTLRGLAAEHFDERQRDTCQCTVVRGAPLIEILRFAHEKDVNLVVIGRHYSPAIETDDEALRARRVTRKATCSVLVLPDEFQIKADTILVPVRNSDCSAGALDVACGIAAATDAKVVALNVFQVHAGYSRVGTSLEEHQALLETAAQHECEKLIKRVDTRTVEVQCECAADLQHQPASNGFAGGGSRGGCGPGRHRRLGPEQQHHPQCGQSDTDGG